MKLRFRVATLAFLGLLVAGVMACNGAGTISDTLGGGSSSSGQGQLTVAIHDVPADFTAINVTVSALTVYPVSGDPVTITDGLPATFDLLQLVGPGNSLNLGSQLVPAGDYDGLDLTLTSVEVVTTGGSQEMLTGPMTVSVPVAFTVADGGVVTVSLDFNADASFQMVGNGMVFTPTITMD